MLKVILVLASLATLGCAENSRPDPCLKAHNKFRRENGVPELEAPSAELQAYANQRGHELATTGRFRPPTRAPYGENSFGGLENYSCADAVQSWYDKMKNSAFKTEFNSIETKQVACAVTKSEEGYTYVVVSNFCLSVSDVIN